MTPDRRRVRAARWTELADGEPEAARVAEVDLVVVRQGRQVSVLYARCTHRGAHLADGLIEGGCLVCPAHGWDYRLDTGVSETDSEERVRRFWAEVDEESDAVWVDEAEIAAWLAENPPTFAEGELVI